ncbi:hypothetical protein BHE74_00008526 [Ensete ventricosum]|nr:hypothetical protein GW17_00002562 [Ensete ventricosum]RWW82984.1 hypothetical protein BHE74_00008526 [Ensete ventricosum]
MISVGQLPDGGLHRLHLGDGYVAGEFVRDGRGHLVVFVSPREVGRDAVHGEAAAAEDGHDGAGDQAGNRLDCVSRPADGGELAAGGNGRGEGADEVADEGLDIAAGEAQPLGHGVPRPPQFLGVPAAVGGGKEVESQEAEVRKRTASEKVTARRRTAWASQKRATDPEDSGRGKSDARRATRADSKGCTREAGWGLGGEEGTKEKLSSVRETSPLWPKRRRGRGRGEVKVRGREIKVFEDMKST